MSGLKQFYLKHIRIFTIILVLIAAFIIYKCWQKKSEADKMTTSTSLVVPKKEFYDLGVASEVAYGQVRSGTGGFSDVDFATRGIFSRAPEFQDVIGDAALEIGESGVEQKTKSTINLPTQYGALYESDIPKVYYEGTDY